MKRIAQEIEYNANTKRSFCIDQDSAESIMAYISSSLKHRKKFEHIKNVILEGHRITDLYDKEEINDKCKGVRAMKFKSLPDNGRIYCREVTLEDKTFVIIACEVLPSKKTQKVDKKTINLIEKIATYEYEIKR